MIYIEPRRVVQICETAIKAVEELGPDLTDALLFADSLSAGKAKDAGMKRPLPALPRFNAFMDEIHEWLACGQLACQPIGFEREEAVCLRRVESGKWKEDLELVIHAHEVGTSVFELMDMDGSPLAHPAKIAPHDSSEDPPQDRSPTQG